MKKIGVCLILCILMTNVVPAYAQEILAAGWPRVIKGERGTLKLFQPKVEMWGGGKLEGQMAFSLLLKDASEPIFGGAWLKADVDVSLVEGLAQLSQIEATNIRLEGLSAEDLQRVQDVINENLGGETQITTLDHILLDIADKREKLDVKGVEVNMQPPTIWVSQMPALLLTLEGDEPILQKIADTGLMQVLNTNMPAFYVPDTGAYYIFSGEQWFALTEDSTGWAPASELPEAFTQIPDEHEAAFIKEFLAIRSDRKLRVLIAEAPAELIVIDGEPELETIPGTELSFVKNTGQHLFYSRSDERWYYMSSGRWFRAANLDDSWTEAIRDLPRDFANIPEDHPKGSVLLTVPGTQWARKASLLVHIPQKITVKRGKTPAMVEYFGEPKFRTVSNMQISYAVNTNSDVFKVGENYFWCLLGVWFHASAPEGPWSVTATLPEELSKIPLISPKAYVNYVKIYASTPETVTFGFTLGYMGIYATTIETVVYGSGEYYPSYVHVVDGQAKYYSYPVTYRAWQTVPNFGDLRDYSPDFYGYYIYHYSLFDQIGIPYELWGDSALSCSGDWVKALPHDAEGNLLLDIEKPVIEPAVKDEQQLQIVEEGENIFASKDGKLFRHNEENGWMIYEDGQWVPYFSDRLPSLSRTEKQQQMDGYIAALKRTRVEGVTPPVEPLMVESGSSRRSPKRSVARDPGPPPAVQPSYDPRRYRLTKYGFLKPLGRLVITPGTTPFGPHVQKEYVID